MIVLIVLPFIALGVVAIVARWFVNAGAAAGDLSIDARSTLVAPPGRDRQLVVTNPGPQPVVVGMTARAYSPRSLDALRAPLVVRPARWYERRQHDRGATIVLGVVEADSQQRWTLPIPNRPSRVVVMLGQAEGRLRIHEHLVGVSKGRGPTSLGSAA